MLPSQADVEAALRLKGVATIQRIGAKFFVKRHVPLYTAVVLFHRFYARRSMTQFDPQVTAYACVFLAGKAEESLVNLRVVVFDFQKEVEKSEAKPDDKSEVR